MICIMCMNDMQGNVPSRRLKRLYLSSEVQEDPDGFVRGGNAKLQIWEATLIRCPVRTVAQRSAS